MDQYIVDVGTKKTTATGGGDKKGAIGVAVVVALVIIVIALHRKRKKASGDEFTSGPYNLQLYDISAWYPYYVGRNVTDWDGDGRCISYSSQFPSVVWCR